jgi:hypothetical protein
MAYGPLNDRGWSWPEGRGTFTGFTPKVYPVAQPIVGADMKPPLSKK